VPGPNTIFVSKYNKYGQIVDKESITVTLPEDVGLSHYLVNITDGENPTCDKSYSEIVNSILSDKIVLFKIHKSPMVIQCPMYSYSEDSGIRVVYINLETIFHIYEENGQTYVEKL
jgi:hypothetical protein